MADELRVDWVHQIIDEAHDYFVNIDRQIDKAADRDERMMQIHREGWHKVSVAVDSGLRAIADAIRTANR